jgi:hypothetical protein
VAYTTRAEVRALSGLQDTTAYPDSAIDTAILVATETIDNYCGTSFEYKPFTATLDGTNSSTILLRNDYGEQILFPRTITSVTIDGTAADTTGWQFTEDGRLLRTLGWFTYKWPGRNVVIVGTAGFSSEAPESIKWAARTLARQHVIDLASRVPDRALQIQSEFGTITMAQAGGPGRPTSLPEVNAKLNRFRYKVPVVG